WLVEKLLSYHVQNASLCKRLQETEIITSAFRDFEMEHSLSSMLQADRMCSPTLTIIPLVQVEAELCIRRLPTIQHRQSRACTTRCRRAAPPAILDDHLLSSTSRDYDETACRRLVPPYGALGDKMLSSKAWRDV